jgi:hypothetical protein
VLLFLSVFERYTEKARRVIFFARYEASQFGSPFIETEHLLLGLLREDKALTNRFLAEHYADELIRQKIEDHTLIREKVSTSVDLPLSNECKRVLAYAAEEAERAGDKHLGTEHLLLGLLREEKCFAAAILHDCGLRLNTTRERLSGRGEQELPPEQRPLGAPDILLIDEGGQVLTELRWTPALALPRVGEYVRLPEEEVAKEFRVERITYCYIRVPFAEGRKDRLAKIEITLAPTGEPKNAEKQ